MGEYDIVSLEKVFYTTDVVGEPEFPVQTWRAATANPVDAIKSG